ncbi:MAG TPA: hypothetical protein VFX65_02115 [Candidatus Limnocylindrales bacterium]|nr:hypothetical protein [Candidatus Limnocylindrales bacterium]
MKSEADFWACNFCRSINGIKVDRCYSCHTPREIAAVNPTELSVTETKPPPIVAVGTYVSSEGRAVIVTIATVFFILATAAGLWLLWATTGFRPAEDEAAMSALLDARLPFLVIPAALGVVALVAYGAWISRVVSNVAALGAGFFRVGPRMAFIEPLIPGVNLYSLPARVAEVIQKLDDSGRGLILVGASWLLTVGPPVVAAVVIRFGYIFETSEELLRTVGIAATASFAVQSIGLLVGLAVIWHVEGLFRARAAA